MPKQTPQKRNGRKWSSLWNRIRQLRCVWQVPNPLRPVDPQQIFWWVILFVFVLSLFAAISRFVFKAKPSVDSDEKARKPFGSSDASDEVWNVDEKAFNSLPKHSPRTPASLQRAFQIMLSYPEWRKAASPRSEPGARSLFHKDERPPEGN